jgi:hypothetical protein
MYYNVKVSFTTEDEKSGKIKKVKIVYLADAESCIEAETNTVKYLRSEGENAFEVDSITKSPIAQIIGVENVKKVIKITGEKIVRTEEEVKED